MAGFTEVSGVSRGFSQHGMLFTGETTLFELELVLESGVLIIHSGIG